MRSLAISHISSYITWCGAGLGLVWGASCVCVACNHTGLIKKVGTVTSRYQVERVLTGIGSYTSDIRKRGVNYSGATPSPECIADWYETSLSTVILVYEKKPTSLAGCDAVWYITDDGCQFCWGVWIKHLIYSKPESHESSTTELNVLTWFLPVCIYVDICSVYLYQVWRLLWPAAKPNKQREVG